MSGISGTPKEQPDTALPPLTQNEDDEISAPRRPDAHNDKDKEAGPKKKKKPEENQQNGEIVLPVQPPLAVNPENSVGHAPDENGWIDLNEGTEEFSANGQSDDPHFNLTSFNPLPGRDFPYSKTVSALSYMRDPLLASDKAEHGTVDSALTPAEANIVQNYKAVVRLPHYIDPVTGKLEVEKRPICWDVYGFASNARLYDADGRAFGTHPGEKPGSIKFIDQCITDMVVLKADHAVTREQGVALGDGDDRMTALINAKVAQLAGLDVTRNKPNETLDQVDPALARKVEQEWARMMKENQPKEQYSPSAAAKVDGLIKAGSSLDYAPSISDKFRAVAAATVVSYVPATPASDMHADARQPDVNNSGP